MKVFGFTIEELRRLIAARSMLLKMLQSSKADQEVIAWVKRERSAEMIRLDDFRTEPGRDCRPGRARRTRSSKRHQCHAKRQAPSAKTTRSSRQ
jgi:hypothetical protein